MTMSMRLNWRAAFSTQVFTEEGDEISTVVKEGVPMLGFFGVVKSVVDVRAQYETLAPWLRRSSTMALPMPFVPPGMC